MFLQISFDIMPGSKNFQNSPLKMDEKQLSSWPWIISVLDSKGYCCIAMCLCMFVYRGANYSHKTDVDQSVLSPIRFELVNYK